MTNKLNSLEDKIIDGVHIRKLSFSAQAVVEYLEKQNANLKDQLYKRTKRVEVLEQQLDNVKFLDRDNVSRIFNKLVTAKMLSTLLALKSNPEQWHNVTDYENCINAICSLALPVIDKERVIK
jgi:uncharacterized protein YdcH (DUF465 family)